MENSDDIFYKVWFPKNTQEITIIGPTDMEEYKKSISNNENLAFIDGMGDRDSIFSVGLLLSRKYPNARIHLELSHFIETPGYNFKKNLVIVGGPGGNEYFNPILGRTYTDINNHACRKFNKISPPSKIQYTDDVKSLIYDNKLYTSEYYESLDEQGELSKKLQLDYGYFSAFPNDFDPHYFRVVMIHGIQTLGVLGASKVFDDDKDRDTLKNYEILKNRIGNGDYSFETFFKVHVDGYSVINPKIEDDKILLYDDDEKTLDSTIKQVFLSHSSKNRDETLRIKEALEKKSISVFMAPWDMEISNWKPQIEAKIKHEKLKILVLFLTEDAQESEVVNFEIVTALDEGKEIVAFQSEDFTIKTSFGLLINGKHKIIAYDNTHKNPVEELTNKIHNYLRNHTR